MSRTCEESHEAQRHSRRSGRTSGLVAQEGKLNELDQMRAKMVGVREKIKTCEERFYFLKLPYSSLGARLALCDSGQTRLRLEHHKLPAHRRDRLASLGTIADTHDIAVSTAYNAINNMVIDTVAQDQDRLASLGTIADTHDIAVSTAYNAINNMVIDTVAQDQKAKTKHTWGIVTLAGQLIDSSGTMLGGNHHVSCNGMSSKLQAKTMSPQDSEKAACTLEAVQQQLGDIEAAVERLTEADQKPNSISRSS
ncbi:hypothetical protein K503DRAFT_787656 [Rhizopogon vinicolor AM-OR11-026]|uniref:Uncharacterized protein n=1 Tax=Rhizopogon vinicolor AM-OR11-026 TaxID=1314800 RepID=A0A1B7MGJ8_9AGAM|nr:hypothetical protein K503DRAFT_787656 [Rhizopogon vinicolor AM-OR11-026]